MYDYLKRFWQLWSLDEKMIFAPASIQGKLYQTKSLDSPFTWYLMHRKVQAAEKLCATLNIKTIHHMQNMQYVHATVLHEAYKIVPIRLSALYAEKSIIVSPFTHVCWYIRAIFHKCKLDNFSFWNTHNFCCYLLQLNTFICFLHAPSLLAPSAGLPVTVNAWIEPGTILIHLYKMYSQSGFPTIDQQVNNRLAIVSIPFFFFRFIGS